jgi:hypothetical protein
MDRAASVIVRFVDKDAVFEFAPTTDAVELAR